jgi:hypothetical protein
MREEINPWIAEQKNFLLLWNWVHFVPVMNVTVQNFGKKYLYP